MCNYSILHQNAHGYVVKCHHCKSIQMAYGTTAIAFTIEQFHDFRKSLDEHSIILHMECGKDAKCVQIPTPSQAITLVYTRKELNLLVDLLDQANVSLEVAEILAIDQDL